jgi:hypothetical protein
MQQFFHRNRKRMIVEVFVFTILNSAAAAGWTGARAARRKFPQAEFCGFRNLALSD